MDYPINGGEPWEWQEDAYYLQKDSQLDISRSLWDDANQNEENLLHIFNEMTPPKACADFDYRVSHSGENVIKELEECRESSQLKSRRMLRFNSQAPDPFICNEQFSSAFLKSKDQEDSLMEDALPDNWISEYSDRCIPVHEGFDQSSEGWLANCFNDSEMHFSSDEMNPSGTSNEQVDISEFCNIPHEIETDTLQESNVSAPHILFKGRISCMQTPTKLATSIAYPFALIKPCGVEGGVTLKDINQRILTPPSKLKNKMEEDLSPSYPTSAFSGKPVVNKTKIRTGGKGSITIMRTKG